MESPPPAPRDAVREEVLETGRARALVDRLYKAVRAVLLYPDASPLPAGFRVALHEGLTEYLAGRESLTLTVRDDQLFHDGKAVHKDAGGEIDLTGALGRDGIQSLSFLRGVTLAELTSFLDLIKRAVKERRSDEDLVTLFWEASFRRIRYKVVEELGEEAALPPARRKPGKTPGLARFGGGPGTGAAPAAGAGRGGSAPGSGEGGEAAKTAGVTRILNQLSDFTADAGRSREFRAEAERFEPASSTVGIILEVLGAEDSPEGFMETVGLIDGLYDRLLDQGDFGPALSLHDGLREAAREEPDERSPRAACLRQALLRAADAARVGKIVAALNARGDRGLDAARRLLTELPDGCVPSLAKALGEIEHILARKMACEVLVARGAPFVEEIGALVLDERWFVVRNATQILSRLGGARATALLQKAAAHPDAKVRRAVLDGAARIPTPEASRVLRAALADASEELQLRALRALSARRDAEAGVLAERRVRRPEFRRLPPEAQQEWLCALARIRGDEALPVFRSLIARRFFFEGKARRYLRLVAVSALGECGGTGAAAYLAELTRDRDELVRDAAALALDRAGRNGRG